MVPTPRAEQLADPLRRALNEMQLLDRGELDLAVGYFAAPGERFALGSLLKDHFVLAMRRGHPAARRKLTANSFAALLHLEISSSGEDTSFVDAWLEREKLSRRIAHRAPYLSGARILSQSNMVATLSSRIARAFVQSVELPYRGASVRVAPGGARNAVASTAGEPARAPLAARIAAGYVPAPLAGPQPLGIPNRQGCAISDSSLALPLCPAAPVVLLRSGNRSAFAAGSWR
jgi:DNA-binding transcriptional LysR family regulator